MDLMIAVVIQGLFIQFRFVVLGVSSLQVFQSMHQYFLLFSARVSMKLCKLFSL